MPPVSEKQRRAMQAAAAGNSTIGIPQSVGEEFAASDPGGKLPVKARSPREAREPQKTDASKKSANIRKHRPMDYGQMVSKARSY